MIPGIVAGYPVAGGGGSPYVSYIGGAYSVDQSGSSVTLAVPSGAAAGDTAVVVLRCRGDRSFSGLTGWTVHKNQVIPSSQTGDAGNTRVYILSRVLVDETSFPFTQSSASAYGAALVVLRGGSVGNNALSDTVESGNNTATITKAVSGSMLVAVTMGNGFAIDPVASSPVAGYTRRGESYFSSAENYFFVANIDTRNGVSAGTVSASNTYVVSDAGGAIWLAEVG